MQYTAVFDIGKTNKKFFLFDESYHEVYRAYSTFEEVTDDDGFPADNLPAIRKWLKDLFRQILDNGEYPVKAINFSTYGASFVHVDAAGRPLTPLYNYTKPYPEDILRSFHQKYGDPIRFARETASPPLGMLNSGLQLYWLKYAKPEIFEQVRWSMHFPQYLSFLFTGVPVSDYTSIGCHTGLWNFEKGDYHDWVYAEGIDRILPPIVPATTSINMDYAGKRMRVGVGIHDSSSALLPYLRVDKKPFLLISTGTWSISLNPFSDEALSTEDLQNDCLNFLRVDGGPVKAARLFLGNEYSLQLHEMCRHFDKAYGYHRTIRFDARIHDRMAGLPGPFFRFESIDLPRKQPESTRLEAFSGFEEAYHRLMLELMELQLSSANRAIGQTEISKIYIDGGFADNDIYVKLLLNHFRQYKFRTTQTPLGSALGAAMVISDKKVSRDFLKKHYCMKKHAPQMLNE